MNDTFREAVVADFEHLVRRLHLPDPDDRHVLAAALKAKATTIVTLNLNDFPAATTSRRSSGLEQHPRFAQQFALQRAVAVPQRLEFL
jgi:hypothetical protein